MKEIIWHNFGVRWCQGMTLVDIRNVWCWLMSYFVNCMSKSWHKQHQFDIRFTCLHSSSLFPFSHPFFLILLLSCKFFWFTLIFNNINVFWFTSTIIKIDCLLSKLGCMCRLKLHHHKVDVLSSHHHWMTRIKLMTLMIWWLITTIKSRTCTYLHWLTHLHVRKLFGNSCRLPFKKIISNFILFQHKSSCSFLFQNPLCYTCCS